MEKDIFITKLRGNIEWVNRGIKIICKNKIDTICFLFCTQFTHSKFGERNILLTTFCLI